VALTREQYDDIMRGYMQKQNRQNQLKIQRREEVYARIPGFKELSDRVPEIAVGYLYSRLGEKERDQSASPLFVRPELDKIAARKRELLLSHGYPEDYLSVKPECPLCGDTGFIDGRNLFGCSCNTNYSLLTLSRTGSTGI